MKRINKLASELNVSVNTLIAELKKISSKTYSLNSKLDNNEIEFLNSKFQSDKKDKIESDKRKKTYYFKLDEDFSFTEKEIRQNSDLYSDYEKITEELELLKNKKTYIQVINATASAVEKKPSPGIWP